MRKNHNKRAYFTRLTALLLWAAMCLSLTACGRDKDGEIALKEGETFTVAVAQEADSLNPVVSQGGLTEEFFLLCYDPLWRIASDGQPVPCIAEDWSLSSDSLTWTIRLRKDVTFSDGHALTAKDVLFSYDIMRHNPTAYTEYFAGVTAIRSPDDYTIVISTEYIKSDMIYNPTPILPRHIWGSYEFTPSEFENLSMTGSGPFVYCPDESGEDGWMFRARENYFGGEAATAAVFFAYYGTVTGAARALAAGEANASFGLTDVQLTTLESVPYVRLIETMLPQAECRGIVFNTRSEHFQTAGMRQVVEYCMDREWFLSMYSGGAGQTGSSFLSPGSEDFLQIGSVRGFSPQQGLTVLNHSGYIDIDQDGLLEYGMELEKLTITLYTSNQDVWAATAATILVEELEEIGVQVNWKKTDEPVDAVCGEDDSWDLCLCSWQGSQSAVTAAAMFKEQILPMTGWENPNFESVLASLRASHDDATIKSYAQQLQQIVYEDCPVAVIAYSADIQAIRTDNWTGYEAILDAGGSLFSNGSSDVYMKVARKTEEG